jgi:hypothetical protein
VKHQSLGEQKSPPGGTLKARSWYCSFEVSRTGVSNLNHLIGNAMLAIACTGIDAVNVIYTSTDSVLLNDSYAHFEYQGELDATFS